ncbi:hypothetical protein [Natronobacterium gregoryi]|uniref:Uncharacterized protein n=2 Tax=Natronobacterium gregoryi TaxID=44930 RepID=L0AK72_NATGS|nr:hypothetical protein [Natronobacterium gregoryi]AFZ73577.1 hypothetical protein Natgr_2406 [Natronobacterium gregoryi SP2]ELY68244.1 hypothetical protein C490_10175 [Natronobacterium gregoryi SP2]PLK20525.1 hypothetical protein CYV19_08750 [Natronobacterium gregoryi SP2]SFJ18061.1 hypothetical protein SAMN05443661_11681 [Natronobacterium gregoryi]
MPGIPEPVVGSDPLTWLIAGSLSVLVVVLFAYTASRWDGSAVAVAVVGAAGYGLATVGLWAGVRLAFYHFVLDPVAEPMQFAWLLVFAGGTIAIYAAIPFFLFARFGYVVPMIGFTAISTLLFFLFLRVGGETDPLALFGLGFAPFFIGTLLVLAVLEAVVRSLLG